MQSVGEKNIAWCQNNSTAYHYDSSEIGSTEENFRLASFTR